MTPERIQEIYSRLENLFIELDPNPSARGPLYLQDLISKTRGYLNETSHFLQEVLKMTHQVNMDLDAEEAAYEVHSDELLATDNRVTLLSNIDDRKAMVNVLLSDDRRRIQKLKRMQKSLSHVEKVVRHRHKELENTMSSIRLQRSLIETEIRSGSFYGDETSASRNDAVSDDDLSKLFDEATIDLGDVLSKEGSPQPASANRNLSPEEQEIQQFLDEEHDIEGIFDGL